MPCSGTNPGSWAGKTVSKFSNWNPEQLRHRPDEFIYKKRRLSRRLNFLKTHRQRPTAQHVLRERLQFFDVSLFLLHGCHRLQRSAVERHLAVVIQKNGFAVEKDLHVFLLNVGRTKRG